MAGQKVCVRYVNDATGLSFVPHNILNAYLVYDCERHKILKSFTFTLLDFVIYYPRQFDLRSANIHGPLRWDMERRLLGKIIEGFVARVQLQFLPGWPEEEQYSSWKERVQSSDISWLLA